MYYHRYILGVLLVIFISTNIANASKTKIWLEGHVKLEIIKIPNHKKSRSSTIAFLVNHKSSIAFQASTDDLKSWYFILELNILEDLKKTIEEDEIFNWIIYDITFERPMKKPLDCMLQDLFVSTFHAHITKETIRHLVDSQASHTTFIDYLRNVNLPLIEGMLDKGQDGYIYLTKDPILPKDLREHKGILSSFFIFDSNQIKTCW